MTTFFTSGERSLAEHRARARLERFRWLLARYQHVWHFAPPAEQFVRLYCISASEDETKAESERLGL